MTLKGKQAKIEQLIESISPDISVRLYILKRPDFDTLIWYHYDDGIMAITYYKERYLEDKLWFPSLVHLHKFARLFDNIMIIESEDG